MIIGSDCNVQSRVKSRVCTPGLGAKVPVMSVQVDACFCVARLRMQAIVVCVLYTRGRHKCCVLQV